LLKVATSANPVAEQTDETGTPHFDRAPVWRRLSRHGEVPVFQTGGRAICQSNPILLHLARTHDALGWERNPDA